MLHFGYLNCFIHISYKDAKLTTRVCDIPEHVQAPSWDCKGSQRQSTDLTVFAGQKKTAYALVSHHMLLKFTWVRQLSHFL